MVLVELYTKQDCRLCDEAKEVLARVQRGHPFELKVILIEEGKPRYDEFRDWAPVVMIAGKVAFRGRINEKDFLEKLSHESASFLWG